MKKYFPKIIPVFIILWMFLCCPGVITDVSAAQKKGEAAQTATTHAGYLENVLFEKLNGRERVSLVVSEQPRLTPPSLQADNSLIIKLENFSVPESLRQMLGKGQLLNVTGVRPQQQTAGGKQSVHLTVYLKQSVPYSVRQEGKLVLIDFNVSGIASKLTPPVAAKAIVRSQPVTLAETETARPIPVRREAAHRYTDRIVSLDFQEADVKSVLRLMAEYGNTSIVSGDDVKGNVTLSMKNVPWHQALDAILKVHGLTQQPMGDVITVMTLERKKKDEKDKKEAEAEQQKADEERKARELQNLVEKGKLRQILIEAKIVEASEEFARNLGVQWGFGNNQSIRSYGLGLSGGTNPITQTNTQAFSYPPDIGYTRYGTTDPLTMAAVNFPSTVLGPAFGLVFGNARGFIETQLQALESTNTGKVISSPKVVTMDNVKAVIKQGDDVPYVTPASGNSPATVTFKEAVLRLEVKPKITEEGRISMEIKATNDTPDYAQGEKLQGNPPIRKNEVESKIVVQDGDTVVIGGVFRDQEDKGVSGLPWFYKIPVLGWLFKTETISREKRQLMIFITPKILSGSGLVEDECEALNLPDKDRCRNNK